MTWKAGELLILLHYHIFPEAYPDSPFHRATVAKFVKRGYMIHHDGLYALTAEGVSLVERLKRVSPQGGFAMSRYRIVSIVDNQLYWSDEDGWGGLARSSSYSEKDRRRLDLPPQGRWEKVSEKLVLFSGSWFIRYRGAIKLRAQEYTNMTGKDPMFKVHDYDCWYEGSGALLCLVGQGLVAELPEVDPASAKAYGSNVVNIRDRK